MREQVANASADAVNVVGIFINVDSLSISDDDDDNHPVEE